MEKLAQMSILIDYYGKLLTPKQLEVLDLYYNNDYSLAEISELLGISRQGVFDNLKRSEDILKKYENKLKLVERFTVQNKLIKKVHEEATLLKNNMFNKDIIDKLDEIIISLDELLDENIME